jgi:hypothetical protein
MERLRSSIITANPDDFVSRKRRYETVRKEHNPQPTNINSHISGFLSETNSMIENYEKEIELLRSKISEMKETQSLQSQEIREPSKQVILSKPITHFSIENLSALNSVTFEIQASEKILFMNSIKHLTQQNPGLEEITNIFNDKILELFNENEKLETSLRSLKSEEEEIKRLNNILKDKESEIATVNEIYSQKFQEVFQENSNLCEHLENFKNEKDSLIKDNIMYKEALVKTESSLKDKEELLKDLNKSLDDIRKLNNESEKKIEDLIKNFEDEKNNFNDKIKENEQIISNKIYEYENLESEKEKLKNELIKKNSEIKFIQSEHEKLIQEKLLEIEKLNSLLEQSKDMNLDSMNSFKGKFEENLNIKEKEIQSLNDKIKYLENKISQQNLENENLREIITKDQIRIKELKEHKQKAEENNEHSQLIVEENNLLKNEINLFKARCEEDIAKIEEGNRRRQEMQLEKEDLQKEIVKREKIIENSHKQFDDLKEKLKERESLIEVLNKENQLIKSTNNKNNLNDQSSDIKSKQLNYNSINLVLPTLPNDFIIDYVFHLYLYDNSINLQNIVGILLNNFPFYMSSIFCRKEDYHLSFSLQHELLEDLFFRVYDVCVKNKKINDKEKTQKSYRTQTIANNYGSGKVMKNKTLVKIGKNSVNYGSSTNSESIPSMTQNEIYMVNPEDIDLDMIKLVCQELLENNIIDQLISLGKKEKSIDEIIEIFINKYEKILIQNINTTNNQSQSLNNSNTSHHLLKYIQEEIRPSIISKIEKYKKTLIDDIQTLIEFSIKNLQNGKISYNNKQLYDFKNFYLFSESSLGTSFKNLDSNNKLEKSENLYISQNLVMPEAVDNVIFRLKRDSKILKSISFAAAFNYIDTYKNLSSFTTEYSLGKISLSIILHCPNLTNLSITDSKLEETHLLHIVKLIDYLKNLKFLDLSGNNLGQSGVKLLAESLKSNRSLLSLYLNKNNIESNGGFYLADSIIKNETLEKLSLSGNKINDNGLSSLLTVLSNNNKTIKYLDLSDNQLLNSDLQSISELITQNHTLNILNISNNHIDAVSSHLIGLSLRHNSNLSIIYLQNTNLNEESAPLLLKNLADSKICEIYLDDNPFGEIGAILLANVLKSNNSIRFVSLRKCNLSSLSLSCLSKVLETNTGLEGLNLEENSFDEQSLTVLEKVIKKKNNLNLKIYLSGCCIGPKARDLLKNNTSFILY